MISRTDFNYIRSLVRRVSGIVLKDEKKYFVEARLAYLTAQHDYSSLAAFMRRVRGKQDPILEREMVEVLTNNETTFFRDVHPFEALREDILPKLIEARRDRGKIQIWSAACSSGQEPYSLAMMLDREFGDAPVDFQIIASDLSRPILERARRGRFNEIEMSRGLPDSYRQEYFEECDNGGWKVLDRICDRIEFREVNLIGSWAELPQFDIILLRNVLIYFDLQTKREILDRVHGRLRQDGYLLLGAAETMVSLQAKFARVESAGTVCYSPEKP